MDLAFAISFKIKRLSASALNLQKAQLFVSMDSAFAIFDIIAEIEVLNLHCGWQVNTKYNQVLKRYLYV